MHFVGGRDIEEWQTAGLSQLQKFARDTGCSKIESYGRPGWEKNMEGTGVRKKTRVLRITSGVI